MTGLANILRVYPEYESNLPGIRNAADGIEVLFEFHRRFATDAAENAFLKLSGMVLSPKEMQLYLDRRIGALILAAAETHSQLGLREFDGATVETIVQAFARRLRDLALLADAGGYS